MIVTLGIAIAALSLAVVLLFAVVDLTREVRSLNKRVIDLENGWLGNRETVYRVGDILPKLEKLANEA